tara:strand:- start:612 stop:1028 length:417 start_codon:yes stop_codon:yes gene_type:complete
MSFSKKLGLRYWIISLLALLWNIMGLTSFLTEVLMTDTMKAVMPQAEREMYENKPAWATAAFFLAVLAGLIGSIGFLLQRKWTTNLFILSLLGIVAHQVYIFAISGIMENADSSQLILPISVTTVGVFLVWYSKKYTI